MPIYLFWVYSSISYDKGISSVQSLSHVNSVWPHGLQQARLPCPLPTPRDCSNSCHWLGEAIQSSHPLFSSSPSPPAFNLSQLQDLFQGVSSSHQVAEVLELQLRISPSNEYSGLISFRMDSFDLLVSLVYNFSVAALTNSYCYSVTQMGHRAMLAAKALLERQFPCLFFFNSWRLLAFLGLGWGWVVCLCGGVCSPSLKPAM